MCTSQVKRVFAVVLAVGLVGAGWGVYQGRAAEDPSKAKSIKAGPAVGAPGFGGQIKGADKLNLPTGPAPTQVLASIGKDGKLVIKTATVVFRGGFPVPPPAPLPPVAPPGGGAPGGAAPAPPAAPAVAPPGFAPPGAGGVGGPAPAIARVQPAWELRSQTYDLDDVDVLDTKGRKVDKKTVAKLLKKETVALASMWGQQVDPLHLRVLKDGILVFVLPAPKGIPGVPGFVPPGGLVPPIAPPLPALPPGQVVPPGAPDLPPGAGGPGGGGVGVAQPGFTGPATVAPTVPPTGVKP